MKNKFNKKIIYFIFSIIFVLAFSKTVLADWDGQPYNPGEVDNPGCLPSQINCDVLPAVTTELDPIFIASQAFSITGTNISNWDTAYNWGNHASAGYVTGNPWTSQGYITDGNIGWDNSYGFITSYTEIDPTISAWAKALTKPSYTATDVGLGNVTNESKATMFASPTLTGTINMSGDINMTGNIIPTVNDTYALGSPSKVWKDLFVGAGSIYVNGQKVLQTDPSNSVLVSADVSQNLILQTTGGGNVELNPASGGGQVLLKSNIVLTSGKTIRSSDLSSVIFSDGTTSGNMQIAGNIISSTNLNGGISITPNGLGNTYVTNGNFGVGTTSGLSKVSINGGLHVGGDSDAGDNNILADGTITGSNLSGTNTGDNATNSQYSGLITSKQEALNGTGFVKANGTTILYDNANYVTGTPWTGMGYVTGTPWASMGYVTGTPWTSQGYITDGNTGWDNSYGFITGYTEIDPAFTASASSGITGGNILDWNTAYGWGNHATAGYLTSANIGGLIPYTGGTSNVDLGVHNLTVDTNSLFVNSANHRVGIGTTNPANTLDVNGNVGIVSANGRYLGFNGFTTGMTVDFRFGDSYNRVKNTYGGVMGIDSYHGVVISHSSTFNDSSSPALTVITGSITKPAFVARGKVGQTSDIFQVQDSSSNLLLNLSSSGNVGIGTTNPLQKFTISGTSVSGTVLQTNISAYLNNGLRIDGTGNNSQDAITYQAGGGGGAGIAFRRDGGWGTYMDFYTNNNSTSGAITQAMTINNLGNVGIGTMVPQEKLSVGYGTNNDFSLGTATNNKAYWGTYNNNMGFAINRRVSDGTFANSGLGTASFGLLSFNGGGSVVFGTANANNVLDTERMRIDKDGNVGIGITTPISKLDVIGSIKATQFNIHDGSGYIGGIGYEGGLFAFKGGASLITRMAMTWDGKVGIGTTIPTNLLSLSGTSARTIWMERNTTAATAGQGLTLSSGGAIAGTADLAGGDLNLKSGISTGLGDSSIRFFTTTAGLTGTTDNTPTEKMTILGNGNVGIGTTNPDFPLVVVGSSDIYAKGPFRILGKSNGTGVGFNLDATPQTGGRNYSIMSGSNGAYVQGGFAIYDVTGGAYRLSINTAGNVGIGTITSAGVTAGSLLSVKGGTSIGSSYFNGVAAPANGLIVEGNVGIGTTNPGTKLELSGATANNGFKISNSDNRGYAIAFGSSLPAWVDTTSPNGRIDTNGNFVFNSGTNGDLYFNYDRRTTRNNYFDGVNYFNHFDNTKNSIFEGNVGIGTTNPSAQLTLEKSDSSGLTDFLVNPAIKTSGNLMELKVGSSSKFRILFDGGLVSPYIYGALKNSSDWNNASISAETTGALISRNITDANPVLTVYQSSASSTGDILRLNNNTGTVVSFKQNGNVGIGTTNPGAALDIQINNTTKNVAQLLNNNANYGAQMVFGQSSTKAMQFGYYGSGESAYRSLLPNTSFLQALSGSSQLILNTQGALPIIFATDDFVERMRIASGGNIGIGTTGPAFPLDVNGIIASGKTSGSGELRSYQDTNLYTSLKSNVGSKTGLFRSNADFFVYYDLVNGDTNLDATYSGASDVFRIGGVEKMRVANNGNIGINKTTPTNILDVDGIISSDLGFNITTVPAPSPASTLSLVADNNISHLSVGTYVYAVTYITAIGETNRTTISTINTDASNLSVQISNIPISTNPKVTGRRIYRTKVNMTSDRGYLLATIANNTTTTFLDTIPDSSLVGDSWVGYKPNTTSKYISVNGVRSMIVDSNLTVFGYGAGLNLTSAGLSTFIGAGAGAAVTNGFDNTFIGQNAGGSTNTGGANTAIGRIALYNNTTGSSNVVVGEGALRSNSTGGSNTAFGAYSLYGIAGKDLNFNAGFGTSAGSVLKTGSWNTFIGSYSGSGSYGGFSIPQFGDAIHSTAIGDSSFTSDSYQTAIGAPFMQQAIITGDTYIKRTTSTGVEVLSNGNLTSGTSWSNTNDCSLSSDAVVCTYGYGSASNITQVSTDFATAVKGGRWYVFKYTITGLTGYPSVNITTGIANVSTPLYLTANGTHSIYFFSKTIPTDFVITTTLASGQAFTIDSLSLKEVNGGDLLVNGNVGIGTTNPTHLLSMGTGGGFYDESTGAWIDGSDLNYKDNILSLDKYGLSTLNKLRPVSYDFKHSGVAQIGFIAQEVKLLIPELVSGEEGSMGLNYGGFSPLIVKSVQELDLKLEDLAMPFDEITNKTFIERFYIKLITWLGSSDNGLEKICVKKADGTSFCVDGDQLERAVNGLSDGAVAPIVKVKPEPVVPVTPPEPVVLPVTPPAPVDPVVVVPPPSAPVVPPVPVVLPVVVPDPIIPEIPPAAPAIPEIKDIVSEPIPPVNPVIEENV